MTLNEAKQYIGKKVKINMNHYGKKSYNSDLGIPIENFCNGIATGFEDDSEGEYALELNGVYLTHLKYIDSIEILE